MKPKNDGKIPRNEAARSPSPVNIRDRFGHGAVNLEDIVDAANDAPTGIVRTEEELTDLELLLETCPQSVRDFVDTAEQHAQGMKMGLREVVLDLGRPIFLYSCITMLMPDGQKKEGMVKFTADESLELVSKEMLKQFCEGVDEFGTDNRVGIDRTLHRISRKLNRKGEVIGLTIRVGRSVAGLRNLVTEELMKGRSILMIGKPGCGKTTVLRDCARYMSDSLEKRVEIIDTSNEIGGSGDIPHRGIGLCRRMMVDDRQNQHQVMLEAVQNHTPEALVIDEIGLSAEVQAAMDISQRGIQLLASAHGTYLSDIVKSPVLCKLIGDTQSVILSGAEVAAGRGNKAGKKTVVERKSQAIFDIVIELRKSGVAVVWTNVEEAVDVMLRKEEVRNTVPGGPSCNTSIEVRQIVDITKGQMFNLQGHATFDASSNIWVKLSNH